MREKQNDDTTMVEAISHPKKKKKEHCKGNQPFCSFSTVELLVANSRRIEFPRE